MSQSKTITKEPEQPQIEEIDTTLLLIDEATIPTEDVSDLHDVVDAINKLCDTMKTSGYSTAFDEATAEELEVTTEVACTNFDEDTAKVLEVTAEVACEEISEDITVQKIEEYIPTERWSDSISQIFLPGQVEDVEAVMSDTEGAAVQEGASSEVYYTASSEVSLASELELGDRGHIDMDDSMFIMANETSDKKADCVIAGHVAAMRERFESMTRTNTPCPDLIRSISPSIDNLRNRTPSPDF